MRRHLTDWLPGATAALLILAASTVQADPGELAGTSWQLVNIASMDDTTYTPDDPSQFTLTFNADGSAAIVADCNRGMGTWSSEAAGQLTVGPIASTRMQCPPGSLSEKFLSQFEWVRSYVFKDGHLFLATMADGSIIEFAPLVDVPTAATVAGEDIRTIDPVEMQQRILDRLFDDYAATHGIAARDPEIDAFIENLDRGMRAQGLTAADDLTPEEAETFETMRRDMARSIIRQWKINRALYAEYGGRVIYQQLGPEPLDALRRFVEERQRAGAFTIHEQTFEAGFWRYFTDDSIHSFFAPGTEASAFEVPPWERHAEANS